MAPNVSTTVTLPKGLILLINPGHTSKYYLSLLCCSCAYFLSMHMICAESLYSRYLITFMLQSLLISRLCDNIVFCPSGGLNFDTATPEEIAVAFDPISQGNPKYVNSEYALGFFAAVAVAADDVNFFLNGYSIGQCKEHALMQRFFAVFELASAPFTPGVGPHDFVTDGMFKAANNFKLTGPGTVGLSSHHGVHGNENNNVEISGVTFEDFEVGAVSLNNVKGLQIKNCNIPKNRHDVPILGSFSAALQIRPYIKALKDSNPVFSMTLGGSTKTVEDVYNNLITSIANVFHDVRNYEFIDADTHKEEWELYNNFNRVVDGPCYVFLVHGKGPAVGGFGEEMSTDDSALSKDVNIVNNNAENIKCFTNEVLAAVVDTRVQNDARGAVLQFFDANNEEYIGVYPDGSYKGNVNLDAQIMVSKAMKMGQLMPGDILQTNVNSVAAPLISWAEGTNTAFTIKDKFRCNGDSMHHVIKGSIMIRVEDCQGFDIQGNTIDQVEILSKGPVGMCNDFHLGAAVQDASDRMLADLRGISVAAVSAYDPSLSTGNDASFISHNTLTNFKAGSAKFIGGIDIQGASEGVNIENNYVNLDPAIGNDASDRWVGLRIRQSAVAVNVKKNNNFVQGELMETRRKLPEYHPNPSLLGGNEWPNNGCPFNH